MSATEHNVKLARIRLCSFCRWWRNCTQWQWPECHKTAYDRGNGTFIDLSEAHRLRLDDAFFDGPASNCPGDKFAGLAPIDYEAEQAETFRQMGERFTLLFDPIRQRLGDAELKTMITGIVAAGGMSARQAEAMFTVMEIPLDA